jgi:hypothetical protein
MMEVSTKRSSNHLSERRLVGDISAEWPRTMQIG